VFADDLLDVGSEGFGFLEAATGIGGFLGTLAMIRYGNSRNAGRIMLASAAAFGVLLAAFSASRSMPQSLVLLFLAGLLASVYLNLGMTTLQLRVPDALRGRVMAIWSFTWFLSAVGGLPASALAEWIGAPATVALGGMAVAGFAVALWLSSAELRGLAGAAEPEPAVPA